MSRQTLLEDLGKRNILGLTSIEINFLLAVLAILQPANTDNLDLGPSSIPTCSGMALQYLSVD